MIIGVDKAQKAGKHNLKHNMLKDRGHKLVDIPCPVGDYIEITPEIQEVIERRGDKLKKMDLIGCIDKSVDTKKDCQELYQCLVKSHKRFSDSCFLASNNGIKLYILVENKDGVTSIDTFGRWKNESCWKRYFVNKRRCENKGEKPPKEPCKPSQLKQIMNTMNKKYRVEFLFCRPEKAAEKIEELLSE